MLPAVIDPPCAQIENLTKLRTVLREIATAISASNLVLDLIGFSDNFMFLRQHYLDQVQRVDGSITVLSAGKPAPLDEVKWESDFYIKYSSQNEVL
jgi:hypothetical protein